MVADGVTHHPHASPVAGAVEKLLVRPSDCGVGRSGRRAEDQVTWAHELGEREVVPTVGGGVGWRRGEGITGGEGAERCFGSGASADSRTWPANRAL